jgi:hypothetical protein
MFAIQHFDAKHSIIYKKIQEKINNQGRENVERQPTKKKAHKAHISNSSVSEFFVSKELFKKDDAKQKMFMEDLTLLIVKNHLPLQFAKSVWLKHLVLQLCPCVHLPSQKKTFTHYFA